MQLLDQAGWLLKSRSGTRWLSGRQWRERSRVEVHQQSSRAGKQATGATSDSPNSACPVAETFLEQKLDSSVRMSAASATLPSRASHLDRLRVLHRSEHFLVVDKHPDLVMNTNPGDDRLSLFEQIQHAFPELHQPDLGHGFYVLHRLDYSTSGVLVVPLTKTAAKQGAKQFQDRRTRKYYLALLRGRLLHDRVDIDLPIGDDSGCVQRMACPDEPTCTKPRSARTRLVVLGRGTYSGEPVTKVLLAPVTGRRHQLRLHCHRLGHTIVGDWTYSGHRDVDPPRMYLHAHRLQLATALEQLDLTAGDPLTDWTEQELVCDLAAAYTAIHDRALHWPVFPCDAAE